MFSYLSQRDPFYSSDTPPSKILRFLFVRNMVPGWSQFWVTAALTKQIMEVPPLPHLCHYAQMCILPQRKDNILPQKTEMPGNGSPPPALWGWRV